jgi:hypothetical protein
MSDLETTTSPAGPAAAAAAADMKKCDDRGVGMFSHRWTRMNTDFHLCESVFICG